MTFKSSCGLSLSTSVIISTFYSNKLILIALIKSFIDISLHTHLGTVNIFPKMHGIPLVASSLYCVQ